MKATKRVSLSETTKKVDSLESGDWKLTFTYESQPDTKIDSVIVNGQKNVNSYFNCSYNRQTTSISFTNATVDTDFIKVIMDELDSIVNP